MIIIGVKSVKCKRRFDKSLANPFLLQVHRIAREAQAGAGNSVGD